MNARTTAGLALAAVAGLALSACSPQLEHPSDEKVDTATSQDAASIGTATAETTGAATATETADAEADDEATATGVAGEAEVLFIDCFGEAAAEPEAVSTDCADPAAQITEISWESWSEDEATGTGIGVDGAESTVELSQPTETGAATVFTVVTVDGVPVN